MMNIFKSYAEEFDDGSYLVVSRGGDQAPQAPVMAGNETAWKTPTIMRTATARYRLALTHAATRRKIRLIESNAKCRHLKKLTCKGTLLQVFICREVLSSLSVFGVV
jgi:hypothetical protein